MECESPEQLNLFLPGPMLYWFVWLSFIARVYMFVFQRGGALSIQDKEGLSALDLTMKDRPAHVVFRNTGNQHGFISLLIFMTVPVLKKYV